MSKTVRNLLIVLVCFLLVDAGLLALWIIKKSGDPHSGDDSAKTSLQTLATTTTTVVTEPPVSEPESTPESSEAESSQEESTQDDSSETAEKVETGIYMLTDNAPLLSDGLKEIYRANKGDYFTGVPDTENPDYIRIDYMYDTKLISKDKVQRVENVKALPTAAVGQRGGSIDAFSGCGPTAAAILVDWEKGEKTTKDELITYTEQHGLANQGSLTRQTGGMTSDKIIELINTYYGGIYVAKNVYNDLPGAKLVDLINTGHRAIVSVRYTGRVVEDWATANVHFVIVCAYEESEGGRFFYFADPFYANGGRSLSRISSSTLEASIKNVKDEPQTIMILE